MNNPWDRPDNFTPKELMIGAGINVGLYNQWLYRDIFTATNEADGPGTISSYSFNDILTVAIIVRLRRADIRLKKASKLARKIVTEIYEWRMKSTEEWPTVFVAFDDNSSTINFEDKNKEMVVRINIDTVISNICGRIEEMRPE